MMTPEQFREKMQEIADRDGCDFDIAHSSMDALMCQMLKELGYEKGVWVFEQQDKWYA